MSTHRNPKGWPSELVYIHKDYIYHSSVTKDALRIISPKSQVGSSSQSSSAKPSCIVRKIADVSHPAHGQHGLFAAQKILPHTWILDYLGEVHCDERSGSDYDLSLYRSQDGWSIGIDASEIGNEARFINDYRGVKERPNCLFKEYRMTGTNQMRIAVWSASLPIKKGDELLVSYGKAWWKARMDVKEDF